MNALWLENNKIDLRDVPQTRQPNEALIKIRKAGICSTDLELVKGYYPYTGIIGHEFVGDVMEDGSFYCGAVCGNLGPSIWQRGRSVQDILFAPPENKTFWESRFGYSARLGLLSLFIAVLIGLPVGYLVGSKRFIGRRAALVLSRATMSRVSSRLSVVWVRKHMRFGSATSSLSTSSTLQTSTVDFGASPMVPITSS